MAQQSPIKEGDSPESLKKKLVSAQMGKVSGFKPANPLEQMLATDMKGKLAVAKVTMAANAK